MAAVGDAIFQNSIEHLGCRNEPARRLGENIHVPHMAATPLVLESGYASHRVAQVGHTHVVAAHLLAHGMLGRTYDSQGTDAGNGFGHSKGCPTVEDTKGLAGMLIDWHDSLYAVGSDKGALYAQQLYQAAAAEGLHLAGIAYGAEIGVLRVHC